jgi:hypothetical protein
VNFASAAERRAEFARKLPRFQAAIWNVFNPYELAGSLRAKEAAGIQYVAFEEGVDQPVLVTLPHPKNRVEGEANPFDPYFQKGRGSANE